MLEVMWLLGAIDGLESRSGLNPKRRLYLPGFTSSYLVVQSKKTKKENLLLDRMSLLCL